MTEIAWARLGRGTVKVRSDEPVFGVGIRSNPALAAKMFETLAERRINLLAVSTSEIKVSALIAEDELELAVRVLHTAFDLDERSAAA